MRAYREPPGRPPVPPPPVDGEGVLDGGPAGEGVGRVDGDDEGVAGGVIEGLAGVGIVPDVDAGMMPYRPLLSRILCVEARCGTSPWVSGFGPVRPIWRFTDLRARGHVVRTPLIAACRSGDLPLDRAPVIDARPLCLTLGTAYDRWLYSHVRGLHSRLVPFGVRLPTMVRWGAPNLTPQRRAPHRRQVRRAPTMGGSHWCNRWTARVLGPVWVWPDLQPHTRWALPLRAWLDVYQTWFDAILSYDSGLVLDTRMLALMGLSIPLPAPMVDLLRPKVRLLSLADIPTRAQRDALQWPETSAPWLRESPWLPGQAPRYSLARWQAFCDQFPDVPVTLPALQHPASLPPWLRAPLHARPSVQPWRSVPVPPDMRTVSLLRPQPYSRAQHAVKIAALFTEIRARKRAFSHG